MAVEEKCGNDLSETISPPSECPDGQIMMLCPDHSGDSTRTCWKKRELVRPEINYRIVVFHVTVPVFICLAVCWWNVLYALLGLCVYILLRLRGITIWSIHVYQRYAPDELRLCCVFEPSCSEYMILSIQKYGLVRGVFNGVMRLRRCNSSNGGIDYP